MWGMIVVSLFFQALTLQLVWNWLISPEFSHFQLGYVASFGFVCLLNIFGPRDGDVSGFKIDVPVDDGQQTMTYNVGSTLVLSVFTFLAVVIYHYGL
jgi:hypothetical protein